LYGVSLRRVRHYKECHYEERYYEEWHYNEWHFKEWHCEECHDGDWHHQEWHVRSEIMDIGSLGSLIKRSIIMGSVNIKSVIVSSGMVS
jgi:hypothetical protein